MNRPAADRADIKVIISYDFWKKHFGGEASALGRTLELGRRQFTVIGVMPAGFQFPISSDSVDVYVTIAEDAATPDGSKPQTENRGSHSLESIARMKPGVTVEQAQADLATIAANLEKQYPDTNSYFGVASKPLREDLIGDVRTALYVLFGAVVCVLLIANANVANLLLARASVRGKEMALRAAMGASRARIIRQLLTESVLLSALGGGFGLLIAQWGTEALIRTVPQNIPRISHHSARWRRCSSSRSWSRSAPALSSDSCPRGRPRMSISTLRSNPAAAPAAAAESKGRLRNGLVMAEVALALVLLICAGLLIQSFARLGRVPAGRAHRTSANGAACSCPASLIRRTKTSSRSYDQFLPRIRAIPGVESASTIVPLPLSGSNMVTDFDIEEHPLPEGQRPAAPVRIIATDYFKTMGIPVRSRAAFSTTRSSRIRAGRDRERTFRQQIFPRAERHRQTHQARLLRG